jgi:hypothetical protein
MPIRTKWLKAGAIVLLCMVGADFSPALAQTRLPARFEEDRVYVTLPTADGASLTLYTDTGGGTLVLSHASAQRLKLNVPPQFNTGRPMAADDLIQVPAPAVAPGWPELPRTAVILPRAAQIDGWPEQGDGFLGAPWFGRGIWTWDYPRQRLTMEPQSWSPGAGAKIVPLHFKTESDGTRPTNFPRIDVQIAGDQVSLLLDTGAETYLTASAARALGGGARFRATSMLAASTFDRLHEAHPEWPFLAAAQETTRSDMLQIPDVQVGGIQAGPLWFTRRADTNFHDFLSQMMDARVEGALGGNAFSRLRMTVDYLNSRAAFSLPD